MENINFKSLFESAPGLYLILLPDLRIVAVSDSYLTATMTKRENILGKGLFDVFPDNPDDPTADGVSNLRASLNSVLKNKEVHTMPVQKYDIRRQDGTFEERYWSPLNKPVLNSNNEVVYIIHRVEDVTDFMRLQKEYDKKDKITEGLRERVDEMEMEIYNRAVEIKNTNKQLETINKEMESFSYSVSHDLRAPLRAINGYARILDEDYGTQLDKEGKRLIETICYNATKMGVLIDELLAFSRLGRKEIQKSTINMDKLVEGVVTEFNNSVSNQAEIKTNKLHNVQGDYELMFQVMINLISNAIKYSSKKKHPLVEIVSEQKNDEIIFSVKDNGAGFDMQYANKLFGVFQRLHTEQEFEGIGVGLAIVQRIIVKHKGKIWAEGKVNEGATFSFSLPIE